MQLRAISGRRSVRVVLEGELDIAGAPLLTDALQDIDSGARRVIPRIVILDLRAVTFVDSAGLHALIEAADACRDQGREMVVVRGPAQVERVFSLTGMDRHLRLVNHPSQIGSARGRGEPDPGAHPLARWSSFRSGAEAAVGPAAAVVEGAGAAVESAGAAVEGAGAAVSPPPPPAPASPGSHPGTA